MLKNKLTIFTFMLCLPCANIAFAAEAYIGQSYWVEKTGVLVSQALDFIGMKVYSTITDNKGRYVLEGAIVREKY